MPPLADLAREAVPVVALVVLLVTAVRHPSGRVEAGVGVVAAVATLATGLLSRAEAEAVVRHLGPVLLFLMSILVVGEVCARAGVFVQGARVVARLSGGRPAALMTGVFVLAALVTAVLSLDATVVLLMPVVVGAALAVDASPWPSAYSSLRMANSASLLLPVSNLTNLLALPHLHLTFAGFAARMAPVTAVVLAVEYVALRLLFRDDLRGPARPVSRDLDAVTAARTPVVVLAVMLAGFVAASQAGIDPFWVSGAAAVVLVGWAYRHRLLAPAEVVRSAHPGFALFVLGLGVVVAALATGPLGTAVADLLPDDSTSFADLMTIAVVAMLLAALVTNLSATLLVLPLLVPLGTTAILAALIGLNVGSGLTWTGSLANLLWRRGLDRLELPPSSWEFHRVSLVITPLALVAGVATLTGLAWLG